jgi:hypothetical protein
MLRSRPTCSPVTFVGVLGAGEVSGEHADSCVERATAPMARCVTRGASPTAPGSPGRFHRRTAPPAPMLGDASAEWPDLKGLIGQPAPVAGPRLATAGAHAGVGAHVLVNQGFNVTLSGKEVDELGHQCRGMCHQEGPGCSVADPWVGRCYGAFARSAALKSGIQPASGLEREGAGGSDGTGGAGNQHLQVSHRHSSVSRVQRPGAGRPHRAEEHDRRLVGGSVAWPLVPNLLCSVVRREQRLANIVTPDPVALPINWASASPVHGLEPGALDDLGCGSLEIEAALRPVTPCAGPGVPRSRQTQ